MIIEIILLVLIILNLVLTSIFAFTGRKNLFLIFAVIEALLGILFAILVNNL